MAGEVLRVIPRGVYDFATPGAGSIALPITQDVWIGEQARGTLLVRTHLLSLTSPNKFTVQLRTVAPTRQDPATFYRAASALVEVEIPAGTSPPALLPPAAFTGGSAGYVSAFLVLTQSTGGLWSRVGLSADLALGKAA